MIWINKFGGFELSVVIIFFLLYGLFVLRAFKAAILLKTSPWRFIFKFLLRTVALGLLIIALMGPSFGDTKKEIQSVGKDIFFCVDLSESMNAVDIQPSRLEKVKFELKNIVNAFSSDRKGIIMFSNEAFLQCPLTYDNSALSLFIQTMNTSLVPNTGTDFAPPLKMALDKLTKENSSQSRQTSKVIVLISDGEDFGEKTEEVIRQIESEGIKLFTLGVGTEQGSRIPTRRGYKLDKNGNEVITKLNPAALKEIATRTRGKYFEINAGKSDVDRLINTINLIEGELRESRQLEIKANRFYYFLAIAIGLLLIDYLIVTRLLKI